jgi:hypothetical protein
MIRRIVEYVAADRDVAVAYIAELAAGVPVVESPEGRDAHERAYAAEDALPESLIPAVDWLAGLLHKRLYEQAWALEDQLDVADGSGS